MDALLTRSIRWHDAAMTRTLSAVLLLCAIAACADGKAKVEAAAKKLDTAVD